MAHCQPSKLACEPTFILQPDTFPGTDLRTHRCKN